MDTEEYKNLTIPTSYIQTKLVLSFARGWGSLREVSQKESQEMNVISFALYGNVKKYTMGAIKNAELAAKFYPGWSCIYYVAPSVPKETCDELLKFPNVILEEVNEYDPSKPVSENNLPGMFTRFIPFDGSVYERVISRDADSRISQREVDAVNEWIESGALLHTMADHVAHARRVNGGLFGLYTKFAHIPMREALTWCVTKCRPIDYGDDQEFLCNEVYPRFAHSVLRHDSFSRHAYPGALPFPTKREGYRFCGEVFDENEIPREYDWKQIPLEQ